jgi:signal transduction histidine kinase
VRDRILALGGQFHIESVEGRGTRAQIKIPVPSDGRATE